MSIDATLRAPLNATIRKIDKGVEIAALPPLSAICRRLLEQLLPKHV